MASFNNTMFHSIIILIVLQTLICNKSFNIKKPNQSFQSASDNKSKRQLIQSPLYSYTSQSQYLSTIYENRNVNNETKSKRKTNSRVIAYREYVFISEMVDYKIVIRAFDKSLSSGPITSYTPSDVSYPLIRVNGNEALSCEFILIGPFKFFTHKTKLIDASEDLYSLVSSIIEFDPISETFTELSDVSGYRLLPDDRYITKRGNYNYNKPYVVSYVYNDLGPTPKIIAMFLINYENSTNPSTGYELTISLIPVDKSEQDVLITNNKLYDKFNYYIDFKILGHYLTFSESFQYFNSRLFVLDSTTVFYIYFFKDTYNNYFVTVKWNYNDGSNSPNFTDKTTTFLQLDTDLLDAMFDYQVLNSKRIVSALVFRKNNADGKYFVSLANYKLGEYWNMSIIDLVEVSSGDVTAFYLSYFKAVGPWVFYCYYNYNNDDKNLCNSWLSNTNDPLDLGNGYTVAKILTNDSSNNKLKWYISDISFLNLDSYGEVIPLIQFYEVYSSYTYKFARFIINTTATPNNAFILMNKNEDTDEYFLTLRCLANQVYDSDEDCYCKYCTDTSDVIYNNQCVSTCSSGGKTESGFCTNTYLWDVSSNSLGTKQYSDNDDEYPCTLASQTAFINNECVVCDNIGLVLMDDLCLDACLDGFCDHSGICTTEPCCTIDQLMEDNTCVDECEIHGNIPNSGENKCIICASGYEIDFTSCVALCPQYTISKINEDNSDALYCAYCDIDKFAYNNECKDACPEGTEEVVTTDYSYCVSCITQLKLYENGSCVDSCSTLGYTANSLSICKPCEDTNLYYDLVNETCNSCNTNSSMINKTNTTTLARYCNTCPNLVENNICVTNCSPGSYKDATSKYCIACATPNPYVNSASNGCIDNCPANEITDETLKKCLVCPGYLHIGECVTTCPETTYTDNISKTCVTCTGTTNLINSSNNGCVSSCSVGETIENNKCVSCGNLVYNGECISDCPSKTYINNISKSCIACSGSKPYINSSKTDCTSSCKTNETLDVNSNTCIVCSGYIYNSTCKKECPINTVISTINCIECTGTNYLISSDGTACVSSCDSSEEIKYDEVSTGKCKSKDKCFNKPYMYNNLCVETCPSKYTNNSSNKCVLCYEVEARKYLFNNECIASCPNNYNPLQVNLYFICSQQTNEQSTDSSQSEVDSASSEISTDSSTDNSTDSSSDGSTDSSSEEENLRCPEYCNGNGDCVLKSNGDPKCSCYDSYKGSKCDLTDSDVDSISSAVDELMNNLSKLTDPTEITNEINAIYNLVKDAPETISDELMNALVSATTDVIDKIKNGEIEASEDFYNLLDNTLSIKTLSNSTVDISEVKEGVDILVDALLESKNLTSITSGDESSSILFNGDSFSVQVSDNGNSTNAQAVLSSLPIVDYSACEKELIAAGIISEGTSLYAVNTCFDYTLSTNYDSSDEDTKSASCSLSSDIVDEYLNKVNTTSCSRIDVKLPTNNQVDSDLYTALSDQGIDIYDSDGEFFNNMCMRLAINSTDISINGRRSIYTLSASCSSGCDYKGMDNNEYVVCSCDSVPNETENYFKSSVFSNILTSNILLVKCFKEAFDLDYLISSWGLWAFTCSTCIGIIALILNLKCCYYYHLMNNIESVLFNDACYGVVPEKVGKVEYQIQSHKSKFNSNKYTSNDNSSNLSNNNIVKLVTSKEFKLNNIDDGSSSPTPLNTNNVKCPKSKSFKENISSILKAGTPRTPKFITKIFDVSRSKADYNDIKNNKESKISFESRESREIPSINNNIINRKLSKHDYSHINNILNNSINDNKDNNVSNYKEISKFQSKNSLNLISYNNQKYNSSTSDVSSNNNKFVFNSPNSFISRVSQDGSDINKFDLIGSPTLIIKDNLLRMKHEKESIACNYSPEIRVERLNRGNDKDEDKVQKVRFHLANVNNLTRDFTKLDYNAINTNRSSVSKVNTGNDDINNYNKNNNNNGINKEENNIQCQETSKTKHHTNKLYSKFKLLDQCDYNIKVNPLSNFYKKGNNIMNNINTINTINNIKRNNNEINNNNINNNNINDIQNPLFKSKSANNITPKPELVGNNEDNKTRIRKETNDNVNANTQIRNLRNLDIQSVSKKSFSEMEVQDLEDLDNSNAEQPASDLRSNMELVHFNSANKINLQNKNFSGKTSSLFGNFMDKADKSVKFNSNSKTLELVSENSSALFHKKKKNKNDNYGIDSKKSENYDNISIKEDISNKDKTAEDVMKQFENITMKDIKTEADFQKLPVRLQIKIDDRSIWQFICHSLAYYHKALNVLLLKSIVNPLWIRIILLTMEFSFEFALNAIFFSMSTIDDIGSQKSGSGSTGLLYLLSNKFWSIFWPVVISTFIGSIINLIIRVPEKYALQLNSFLITKDKDNIKTGYEIFNQNMKSRYIIWICVMIILHMFLWYFVLCFCGVYINTNDDWLKAAALSIGLSFILFELNFVVFKVLFWKLAKQFPNYFFIGLYAGFLKFMHLLKG